MNQIAAISALRKLGLDLQQLDDFFSHKRVVYSFLTEDDPGVAIIEWDGMRVRSGILEIYDIGGGFWDFLRFRNLSREVAAAVGAIEYELFGGEVIHQRLEFLLIRQGFQKSEEPVPEELGGGTMTILYKVFSLSQGEA